MPTVNEHLTDRFISHAIYLRRLHTGVVRQIISVLNQADKDLIGRLERRLAAGQARGFTTQRIRALVNELRVVNSAAYSAVGKKLETELLDVAEYEAEFTQSLIQGQLDTVRLPLALTGVSPQTLRAVVMATPFQGKLLGQHISTQARLRMQRIRTVTQQGIVQGLTNDEMVRRIRGTRALKYRDGILEISRHEAETLSRTGVAAVTGEARDELYRANADIVEGERWEAILDGRTTLVCQSNDGSTRSLDPETGNWGSWSNGYAGGYPAHWNERSTLVPTLRSYQELGLDSPRVEDDPKVVHTSRVAKTRRQVRKDVRAELRNEDPASWSALTPAQRQRRLTKAVRQRYADLAGEVPAGTAYHEWLKKQPRAFVDEVLGPTRAEAFLSGKLSIDRFTDDFGKPLTLQQLKLRDAAGRRPPAGPKGRQPVTTLADVQRDVDATLESLPEVENVLRRQRVEHAVGFNRFGGRQFYARGEVGRVAIRRIDAERSRRGTITHNHPSASPFSPEDLGFAVDYELRELRAVGSLADGSRVDYSLHAPKGGWSTLDRDGAVADLRRRLTGIQSFLEENGRMREFFSRADQSWVRFAEKWGLRYERKITTQ